MTHRDTILAITRYIPNDRGDPIWSFDQCLNQDKIHTATILWLINAIRSSELLHVVPRVVVQTTNSSNNNILRAFELFNLLIWTIKNKSSIKSKNISNEQKNSSNDG